MHGIALVNTFNLNFEGKRVLVTGSTMGIGHAIAGAFHGAGAHVAINGRTRKSVANAIDALGGGDRLFAASGDFSQNVERTAAISSVLAAFGGLDILVVNAGRGDEVTIDAMTLADWDAMIGLNIKAAFFASQACVPALRQSRGCIVHVASVLSLIATAPNSILYCISKSAMVQMTRSMAVELAPYGVRVNAIAPGFMDTPMIAHDNEQADNQLYDYINYTVPLGRIGQPDECAGAVLYLAAPFAGFTTGSVLVVDGGIMAGRRI